MNTPASVSIAKSRLRTRRMDRIERIATVVPFVAAVVALLVGHT